MLQLAAFSQNGAASKNYADGNAAFAKGQAAMYLQGPWALSQLVAANKNVRLGSPSRCRSPTTPRTPKPG